jgi:hypothetical protein
MHYLVCDTAISGAQKLQISPRKNAMHAHLYCCNFVTVAKNIRLFSKFAAVRYALKAWDFSNALLIFVRRGVGYCNAVAIPLPSLGVSSLDLGRLPPASGPFFCVLASGAYSAAAAR